MGDTGSRSAMDASTEGSCNSNQLDTVWETFQKSFVEVEAIFDQNRNLIREISQNHENRGSEGIAKNVGLIRELNSNIGQVVELYTNLSSQAAMSKLGGSLSNHETEPSDREDKITITEANEHLTSPSHAGK